MCITLKKGDLWVVTLDPLVLTENEAEAGCFTQEQADVKHPAAAGEGEGYVQGPGPGGSSNPPGGGGRPDRPA